MSCKDPLLELLALIEEEPEERTLEALAADGVIRLFEEPQHSREVLLLFHSRYGVHSLDVAAGSSRVIQLASEQDLIDWRWAIRQFVTAGGILELLPAIPQDDWFGGPGVCTSPVEAEPEREQRGALPPSIAAWIGLV